MDNNSQIKDPECTATDKKTLVYDFIKDHGGQVFSFQLINYFTQHYIISADRLARFLRAEGKIASREPTEEEKIKYNLHSRTVIFYIPNSHFEQQEINWTGG